MKHKGAGIRNVRITLGAAAAIGVAGALAVPALARGNSKNGENVFVEHCSACHFEFKAYGNNVGPNLISVTGRKAGSFKGFLYSDGMKAKSHMDRGKSAALPGGAGQDGAGRQNGSLTVSRSPNWPAT